MSGFAASRPRSPGRYRRCPAGAIPADSGTNLALVPIGLDGSAEVIVGLSDVAWTAIGALGAAAIGALVVAISTWITTRSQWRRERVDRRRDERRDAYAEFLRAANDVAHRIGNLAESDYGEADTDSKAAAYAFDTEVTPRFRLIEIVGSDAAVVSASELRERLREFRDRMTTRAKRPRYESDEYNAVYGPVFEARRRFVEVARADVGP